MSRGSTLVCRLRAFDAGHAAGFHIPRAPGRTFCRTPQDGLQPVAVPLLPELRGILFPIVALFDSCQLTKGHHSVIPRRPAQQADVGPTSTVGSAERTFLVRSAGIRLF